MGTTVKFDPKKPYGIITGHTWARFEQNGVLYDYTGKPRDYEEPEEVEEPAEPKVEHRDPLDRDFGLEHAKEFLRTILSGGPVTKSSVYKESQNNNQEWEKVQQAFNELGGEKIRNGNWTLWKLKAE